MSVSFESLRVWHDARRLASRIYSVTRATPFASAFGLRDQIRRAAVPAMSNIAEGYERGTPREFAQFLRVAKASVGEVRSQIYVAEDVGYLDAVSARELRQEATLISRQIAGMLQEAQRAK